MYWNSPRAFFARVGRALTRKAMEESILRSVIDTLVRGLSLSHDFAS